MNDAGFDLKGRRAVVTGASAGIGAGVAVRLANAGATVVAVSRSGQVPDAEGSIEPLVADLSDDGDLERVMTDATHRLGGLDILVNNAALADWLPLQEINRAFFDGLMRLNLWAPLRLCQMAHPFLAEASNASVVMIGSIDAVRPSAGAIVYGASKAGLGSATVALAKEWSSDGIRVNQVNPGLVDTPMAAEAVQELEQSGISINMANRAGTIDEIAGLVHYLVAPVGRFANGASFTVDGGALALGPFDMKEG